MDRREAIKNMTMALGYTIATPALLSILSSCENESTNINCQFLDGKEQYMIKILSEIMLPLKNVYGSETFNFLLFIDKILYRTASQKDQIIFRNGGNEFGQKLKATFGKKPQNCTVAQYEFLVEKYFNVADEKSKEIFNMLKLDYSEISEETNEEYLIYKFLTTIKEISLLGYYSSQAVMMDVLHYNPVPGIYKGCVDL